ncbi:MAG: hypothetical protein ACI4XD_06480 [Clostridia bacterium]
MNYKTLFENIYNELNIALQNSKKENNYFMNTYVIPSEIETQQNKGQDRPFASNIRKQLDKVLENFNNELGYFRDGDIYYITNDLEYVKRENQNPRLKIQFIQQKPPVEERNVELYYYDLRDSEIDRGYTIEENVLVNNIGSLVTNQDILKGKKHITDEELESLDYEEVNYLYNEMENEMEM